jgi:hypothetical protein
MEAYYQYCEQTVSSPLQDGKVWERIKNLPAYADIDSTLDDFQEKFFEEFLSIIPKEVLADRTIILKRAKDFYRARGNEKSLQFLLRILFDKDAFVYLPKRDILRASDGKWYIQKSLRIANTVFNGASNTNFSALNKYISREITGNTSNATAIVERVDRYYEAGFQIDELVLSSIRGAFLNGENITTQFEDLDSFTKILASNVYGGILVSAVVTEAGSSYRVGDPVVVESTTGSGAIVEVAEVTTGNVGNLTIVSGGAGFRANDQLLITGFGGSGANGYVSTVDLSERVHPNTYYIQNTSIELEINTPLNNAVYNNLKATNLTSWIANGMNTFVYANTGPVSNVIIVNPGADYQEVPQIDVQANVVIRTLGILGRMEIAAAGTGYAANEKIIFTNKPGGTGFGGYGNVTTVNGSGAITNIRFESQIAGGLIGGVGYDQDLLPLANVSTVGGSGAWINVRAVLGDGEVFSLANTTLGAITRLIILNRGSNYSNATANLRASGDGTAQATLGVITGIFTYPGRFLNDDGFLSSFNFLQDRHYYQNYSYVVRVKKSFDNYKKYLKQILHPAGMKAFGEYMEEDNGENFTLSSDSDDSIYAAYLSGTYSTNNGNVKIVLSASTGNVANILITQNVNIDFLTGNFSSNDGPHWISTISSTNTWNTISSNLISTSGTVIVKIAPERLISYVGLGASTDLPNNNVKSANVATGNIANGHLVLVIGLETVTLNTDFSTVTVGGQTATKLGNAAVFATNQNYIGLYAIQNYPNTFGNVIVTLTNSVNAKIGISTYRVRTNNVYLANVTSNNAPAGTNVAAELVAPKGAIWGIIHSDSTQTMTWTNAEKKDDFDANSSASFRQSTAINLAANGRIFMQASGAAQRIAVVGASWPQ